MADFDWQRFLLNDLSVVFLGEVAVRVVFAYIIVFAFLKVSGRRGIKQLSLFEIVIILTLGSASGDVTFYEDVPVLPVAMVFVVLLVLYRITTWSMARSPRFARLIEGQVITLIQDGRYVVENIDTLNISENEFLMELRQAGIEHLGQVRLALVEVDGQLSTFCYADDEMRPGLSVLPPEHRQTVEFIPAAGLYACNHCGAVEQIEKSEPAQSPPCSRCKHQLWSRALDTKKAR